MGNSMVVKEKVIRIMKPDGKILEYRAPMKVYEVLTQFSGHALSADMSPSMMKHLRPETKLLGGRLYYLVHLPALSSNPASPKKNKKVRFSDPEVNDDTPKAAPAGEQHHSETTTSSGRVVRIKLVLSKKELQEMLRNGGVSVSDMVSKLPTCAEKSIHMEVEDCNSPRVWKPILESIPEAN